MDISEIEFFLVSNRTRVYRVSSLTPHDYELSLFSHVNGGWGDQVGGRVCWSSLSSNAFGLI